MKKTSLFAAACVLALPLTTAFAASPASTMPDSVNLHMEETAPSIAISDDFYKAGGDVIVNTAIKGDLYSAGGTVHVTKTVGRDLVIAGGTVVVDGAVGDDVRVFGGTVEINAPVNGDLLVFGGQVTVKQGVYIGGDVYIAAGKVRIDGLVRGMTRIEADEVTIAGTLNGPAEIRADRAMLSGRIMGETKVSSAEIGVGDQALFGGNLRYWRSAGPLQLGTKAKGKAVYDMTLQQKTSRHEGGMAAGAFGALLALLSLYSLVTSVIFIGILLLLTRTFFVDAAKKLVKQPFMSFVKGLLYLVATPAIIVIVALTIVGIPLAVVAALLYAVSLMLAKAMTSVLAVRFVQLRGGYKWGPWAIFGLSIAAYLALKLIMIIPVLGWLVCFVVTSMAFGAILMTKWEKAKKVR
jgi:hypothetical protein